MQEKKYIVIMVSNLKCFEYLLETMNINLDQYELTFLCDDRKNESFTPEVANIFAKSKLNQKVSTRFIGARSVIDIFKEKYTFNIPEIIEDLGCIVKPIFMSVMDHEQLDYDKIFIMDEDIVVLNDIAHFWEHDFACKGARFLGHYPNYYPVCQRLFDLEAEGKHQNTGHVIFTYREDYGKYFTEFFNTEEAKTWYENKKRNKGNFFYGEQGFTSYYLSAYLPSIGIQPHGFPEKEVTITFNQDHDHKIAKRCVVHYPVKKKEAVIEKIRKGLEMAKQKQIATDKIVDEVLDEIGDVKL